MSNSCRIVTPVLLIANGHGSRSARATDSVAHSGWPRLTSAKIGARCEYSTLMSFSGAMLKHTAMSDVPSRTRCVATEGAATSS